MSHDIPPQERKRIINEFITKIMEKLRIPSDEWEITFTERLHHPTAYVNMGDMRDKNLSYDEGEFRLLNMAEAIQHAYYDKYIEPHIVEVPNRFRGKTESNSSGILWRWDSSDNDWLMKFLLESKGMNLIMKKDKGGNYLIYQPINYEGESYITVLNTNSLIRMWCNIYKPDLLTYHKNPKSFVSITLTPLAFIKTTPLINWNGLPWEEMK